MASALSLSQLRAHSDFDLAVLQREVCMCFVCDGMGGVVCLLSVCVVGCVCRACGTVCHGWCCGPVVVLQKEKWLKIQVASSAHRMRHHIPAIDADANPFCQERQLRDAIEVAELNKVVTARRCSLARLLSGDGLSLFCTESTVLSGRLRSAAQQPAAVLRQDEGACSAVNGVAYC